jgi:hypothetical protein
MKDFFCENKRKIDIRINPSNNENGLLGRPLNSIAVVLDTTQMLQTMILYLASCALT